MLLNFAVWLLPVKLNYKMKFNKLGYNFIEIEKENGIKLNLKYILQEILIGYFINLV